MSEESLIVICCIAFGAVMILLGLLAAVIQGIARLFGDDGNEGGGPAADPAMIAAIQNAVAMKLPGSRVVRIEEREAARGR